MFDWNKSSDRQTGNKIRERLAPNYMPLHKMPGLLLELLVRIDLYGRNASLV